MACNKQTSTTSHTNPETSAADRRFHFRDTDSDPKFYSRFHTYIHANHNTNEHPDVVNNVGERGGTETSTNSGRYTVLISLISCILEAVLYITSHAISGTFVNGGTLCINNPLVE